MPKGVYQRKLIPVLERIQRRLIVDPITGCWLWTGCVDHGYGCINVDGKSRHVHRTLYEILVGPVGEGLELDHVCHSPEWCDGGYGCPHRRCANVDHLEPVSLIENLRRGCKPPSPLADFQRAKTHCPAGHEYSAQNTYLTPAGHRKCYECIRARSAWFRRSKVA